MLRKATFLHTWWANTGNRQKEHMSPSSREWRQEALGGRKGPSVGSIAQLAIWKEAFGGETTGNALFKQWRDREMDWGLCGERDRCGKNPSSRRRDSGDARAKRFDSCWKHRSDNGKAENNVCRDVECYRRQYEWSCKFRRRVGWGRPGRWWRWYRAQQG